MKYLTALVVGIAGTLVLGAPAADAKPAAASAVPAAVHIVGNTVVIAGKVKGHVRAVRIAKRKHGHWVVIRSAAVRHGHYRTTVRPTSRAVLQVRAAGRVIRTVVVSPAAVATDACGTVLKKADGSAWSCSFVDQFNGTTLDRSVWTPQTAFAMGTQAAHTCYADDPSNVNVSGGSLNLSVRKVAIPAACAFGGLSGPTNYVSGGVMSYRTFSQQYGRYEARIKNTATKYPGLHEAFWLWPDDRVPSTTVWPYAGEMDISETYSSYPTLSIPFLHYSSDAFGNLVGTNTAWNCYAPRGVWNTYALQWSPTKVQIFVNGKSCLTNTSGNSAFLKPYI
ncbi:MAG: glycoside hydrolase family 16 protein, partial [Frankiales bacterium]|nr:glycoside hydrolase family 16 protein [Frankiales bacterium]